MSGIEIVFEAVAPGRVQAELLAAGFFFDERPLRGAAGMADWRLCGAISELILAGQLKGAKGEAVLVPSQGRLAAERVLLVGLGRRSHFQAERARETGAEIAQRSRGLGIAHLALTPPGPGGELAGLVPPLVAGLAEAEGDGAPLRVSLCLDEDLHRPCRTAIEAARVGGPGERIRFGRPRAPAPGLATLIGLPEGVAAAPAPNPR